MFNYEINSVIIASVEISNGLNTAMADIIINLNNIDEIEYYLSSSKQSYMDAQNGDWIAITELEYNSLFLALDDVNKVATTDNYYDLNEMTYGANSPSTWANDNGTTMPSDSYVFALKYYAFEDNVTTTKLKQSSTSVSDGYMDLGNPLPLHNSGTNYFILKGNDIPTSDIGYLAIYSFNSIGFKPLAESMYVGEPNDVNTILNVNLSNSILLYQGLSTTLKQWN